MVNGLYHLKWYTPDQKDLWNLILRRVKMIPSRKWNPSGNNGKGCWTAEINPRNTELITDIGFKIKGGETNKTKRKKKEPNISLEYKKEILRDVDPRLRAYQLDGVRFLQYHNFRAINADECGLGKTAQVVSAIRTSGIRPALFIVPATLKINIKRECEMWLNSEDNDSIHIVEGNKSFDYADKTVVIINYAILASHTEYIITKLLPKLVVFDEVHLNKGSETYISKYYPDRVIKKNETVMVDEEGKRGIYMRAPKRVEASRVIVNGLSEEQQKATGITWTGVSHVIPLSATPILNSPADIFNVLQFIHPERFKSRKQFEDFFCKTEAGFKPGTVKITGGKHLDLLHCELVEKYMIRRKSTEVLKELPPTITTVIPIQMEGKELTNYREAEEDIVSWIKENDKKKARSLSEETLALSKFSVLMGLAYEAKKKHVIKFIKGLLNDPSDKIIVFMYHKKAVNEIKEAFGDIAVKLNGECSMNEKQKAIDSFQNDPKIRVFVGNVNSAGVGITLTKAAKVVFVETGFNMSLVSQCIGRSNRMGQTASCVMVYFITADDSIESAVMKKLDNKKELIDGIMEGEDVEEESMLSYLWKTYSDNKKGLDIY